MSEQDAADEDSESVADEPGDAATEDAGTPDGGEAESAGEPAASGEAEAAENSESAGGVESAGNSKDAGRAESAGDAEATEEIEDADAAESADGESGEETLDESLVERVAESDPESVATELSALRERVDELEAELDERESEVEELETKLRRKQADFQNFKKRMEKRREQERERATEDLVERLVEVRDNLVRALEQDEADAEDIVGGVETTLSGFDRVLAEENVDVVEPEPGEEVDPHTHEVLMRVDSDQPEGTVDDVHRPGYVMAEKVIQTAQVTVSDGD